MIRRKLEYLPEAINVRVTRAELTGLYRFGGSNTDRPISFKAETLVRKLVERAHDKAVANTLGVQG